MTVPQPSDEPSAVEPYELPMFPLGTVLLPGAPLPLHVFEPRYRALVRDSLAGRGEFGVVLIERGSEVGGGDARFRSGCVARILSADELPDGRWVLGAAGARRIRVESWLPDAPYPRAVVQDWPDGEPPPEATDHARRVESTLRRVLALAAEVGAPAPPATVSVSSDPVLGSYQLAAFAPIGPLDRLRLLEAGRVDERLDFLEDLLVDVETLLVGRLGG